MTAIATLFLKSQAPILRFIIVHQTLNLASALDIYPIRKLKD